MNKKEKGDKVMLQDRQGCNYLIILDLIVINRFYGGRIGR